MASLSLMHENNKLQHCMGAMKYLCNILYWEDYYYIFIAVNLINKEIKTPTEYSISHRLKKNPKSLHNVND